MKMQQRYSNNVGIDGENLTVFVESYQTISSKSRCHKSELWQSDLFFLSAEISVNILPLVCGSGSIKDVENFRFRRPA